MTYRAFSKQSSVIIPYKYRRFVSHQDIVELRRHVNDSSLNKPKDKRDKPPCLYLEALAELSPVFNFINSCG
jgi:hypothetical protein